ncbi:hypothetical protein GN244_ATG10690 [Phytophthora infestans]|uniref:Uncharacterized protein n=1 Tax=Phytophthora infestans TaxID=4787 RepID=A0A833SRT9_PHYIN|nr:hypothetical protein GN244_ATG10690 [Phytophthora infestans]
MTSVSSATWRWKLLSIGVRGCDLSPWLANRFTTVAAYFCCAIVSTSPSLFQPSSMPTKLLEASHLLIANRLVMLA